MDKVKNYLKRVFGLSDDDYYKNNSLLKIMSDAIVEGIVLGLLIALLKLILQGLQLLMIIVFVFILTLF